jgi:hypothetical protein
VNPRRRVDLDRDVDSIRRDLRKAIERDVESGREPRRRRRTLGVAFACLFLLTLGSAGAGAVIFGTTGIPAIDQVLNARQANQRQQPRPPRSAGIDGKLLPSARQPLQPAPGTTSDPLPVPKAVGTEGVGYVNTAGNVCFVTVAPDPDSSRMEEVRRRVPGSIATCWPSPEEIAAALDHTPAVVAGIRAAEPTFVVGYAAENVEDLAVTTPAGQTLAVKISGPWKPETPGSAPIRIFVGSQRSSPDRIGRGTDRDSSDPRRYRFRARLDDGRTVRVP